MEKGREGFISFINERLTGIGFTKEGERWTLEQDIQNQAQVVIVNGRRVEQPAESRHVKLYVEVFGDGCVKDDNSEIPFVEVNFDAVEDGVAKEIGPTFCFGWDDEEEFNYILNKIFGV